MSQDDLGNFTMDELFRAEAEGQCASLSDDLLALEKAADPAVLLERLMRAAHSLKGAARIVGRDDAVKVAHAMEDRFVRAQKANIAPGPAAIDLLLQGVDLLKHIAGLLPGTPSGQQITSFVISCEDPAFDEVAPAPAQRIAVEAAPADPAPDDSARTERRDLRMDAEQLNNLLGLAGQAMVASQSGTRNLWPARAAIRRLQVMLAEAARARDELQREALLRRAVAGVLACQSLLAEEDERRELQARQVSHLCGRIYQETLACRLRPFADIVPGVRRLARDLARDLGKQVDLRIDGESTGVDRDLLDRLDGPLAHLVRNALDHGIETPAERLQAGKPASGTIEISARHQGGWLVVAFGDDGRGFREESIKEAILQRGLAAPGHVAEMTEAELLEFLLLPGFSLSKQVTEISGRGVGLDAVRAMTYGAGGSLRLGRSERGGFRCEITLPVSLSLVRALVCEIASERFALPLTRLHRVLQVAPADIRAAAGRQHVVLADEHVEILSAAEVLELGRAEPLDQVVSLVILQGPHGKIGLTVARFLGMSELSLQRLDPALGRLPDVSAVAVLDSGDPVVVLDPDDLGLTASRFSRGSQYQPIGADPTAGKSTLRRILVADDSLTVRELERKLLVSHGYAVNTSIDGADAWNALRNGKYDLLVTDIDMPRMDGIELVRLLRADARLRDLPVIVVSYKDRPEDRAKGLEAGADFYLPKSSYQDESLLNAVRELIGAPVTSS